MVPKVVYLDSMFRCGKDREAHYSYGERLVFSHVVIAVG